MSPRTLRHDFLRGLGFGLRVVWPILSALLLVMVVLGVVIGRREGWSLQESLYFEFVTGLTIGYGDLAPKLLLSRALALVVGGCGLLLTALIAAIAVKALTQTTEQHPP